MENSESDLNEAIRLFAIDEILGEGDISPLPFSSLDEADLIEETYVDEEINYNEVDLDTFL